ncbi:MAG: hypothetical protein HOE48_05315 [Candidatus Latescibacteria bacterium]|nr:hypothetical protein [Candidatus Latescibacterota bacterium]MBT4137311.1 hypothetical protein [Candidatus Latescibacterota bacterium]
MATNFDISDLIGAAAGPCLMLRDDDVASINAKIDTHDWAKGAFDVLTRQVKGWLGRKIEIPERGGQWPHWYACEDCGIRLETVSPTEHKCAKCDRVYSGEPWDSVPLTAVHQDLSQALLSLGVYYALTGEQDAARKAAQILLGYAEQYPHYPIRDHNLKSDTDWATKVSWGTLGESVWLIPVCAGYDLIRDAGVFMPAEHQAIREQLLRPAARLIMKHNIGIHNIQCWHNAAIGSAGLMLRDRDLVSFAVESEVGVLEQIKQGVLSDGFWHEGSWGYHFYGMRPLLAWVETLRNCGLDLYDMHLKRMFDAPLKAMLPDGSLPAFHDSGGPHLRATAPSYEVGFARYQDPALAWPLIGESRDSLQALLYGAETLPKEIPETGRSTHLNRSGFVYLRQGEKDDPNYLALDYGPHGGGHGHPDKLGFVLYGAGQVLAPDPGSVAYGIPIYQKWYKQTVSHNTLLVNQKSQIPCTGQLDVLANGKDFDVVRISAEEAYEGVRLSRTVLFLGNTTLFLDRMTGGQHHMFDWVLHCRGQLRTDFKRSRSKESIGEGDGYELIEDVRLGAPEGNWRATWRTEDAGLRLSMVGSRNPTEVISGRGYDNAGDGLGTPGESQTPLIIARRRVRRRTTFGAVLQVFKQRPVAEELSVANVSPSRRARGLTLTRGKTKTTLISAYMPGAVTWEGIEFEGRVLVAQVEGHKVPRVVLCEGTKLTWDDQIWLLEKTASVQIERLERGMRVTNVGDNIADVGVDGRAVALSPGKRWMVPNV